jgi:hypothetical protein
LGSTGDNQINAPSFVDGFVTREDAMSFDLAVWEGPRPASSDEALERFEELYERYIEEKMETPSPTIVRFVKALTATFPDLTDLPDDRVDESPWSDGPLLGNASGPFFYFGMSFSRVEEVFPSLLARRRGVRSSSATNESRLRVEEQGSASNLWNPACARRRHQRLVHLVRRKDRRCGVLPAAPH